MLVPRLERAIGKGQRRTGLAAWLALATLAFAHPLRADWSTDPGTNNLVVAADGYQSQVAAVADGASGVLLVWRDTRAATPGLYAQHLDVAGTRLWSSGGALVCALDSSLVQEYVSRAASDGGLDLAWVAPVVAGPPALELRIQHLDAAGAPSWGACGQQVFAGPNGRGSLSLIGDNAGGTILVWADARNGLGVSQAYAQRYSPAGVAQWAAGGTQVAAPAAFGFQGSPRAREDGAGGVFVAWLQGEAPPFGLVAQRLDPAGSRLWSSDRVVCCTGPPGSQGLTMVPDDTSTELVFSIMPAGVYQLRAQRVDAEAAPQWGATGVPVFDIPESFAVTAFSDGSGGLLVLASRIEAGAPVRVQRLLADGSRAWGVDGVVVANASGTYPRTSAAPDGSGGLIVIWPATGPSDIDLRAQRVSAAGTLSWGPTGVALATASGDQSQPAAVASPPGGAIVAWSDRRPVTHDDLYASRLNPDGTLPVELLSLSIE